MLAVNSALIVMTDCLCKMRDAGGGCAESQVVG